jgi:hypothetical protein
MYYTHCGRILPEPLAKSQRVFPVSHFEIWGAGSAFRRKRFLNRFPTIKGKPDAIIIFLFPAEEKKDLKKAFLTAFPPSRESGARKKG